MNIKKSDKKSSLTQSLILFQGLIGLIVIGLTAYVFIHAQNRSVYKSMDEESRFIASTISLSVLSTLNGGSKIHLADVLDNFMTRPEVVSIQVLGRDGKTIVDKNNTNSENPIPNDSIISKVVNYTINMESTLITVTDSIKPPAAYRTLSQLSGAEEPSLGTIEVKVSTTPLVIRNIEESFLLLLLLCGSIALFFILMITMEVNRIHKPLSTLRNRINNFRKSALSDVSLEVDDFVYREIDDISEEINELMLQIRSHFINITDIHKQELNNIKGRLETTERNNQAISARYKNQQTLISSLRSNLTDPVVAIKQNAGIIESKTSSPSDLNLTRQIISTSSDLIELISGVTNENLFNRELAVTNPVSTDLITCVDSAINGCVSRALEKNLSIFLITDPDIPRQLSFDGQWLSRIIRSLINNSISASNDGSEDITVSISSQPITVDGGNDGENEITIEVTDGGAGMSKNTISTLSSTDYNIASDQFQNAQVRLDPNSTYPRHFSIAIAKRIIEEMGGSLTYTSAFDISTTATITIPMRAATDQETITRRTRSESAKVSLVIGIYHPDNQNFAYSMQHKLRASYLNATIISNISKIKNNQYDVIFTLNASASLELQKQISGKSKHIISIEHELNDDKLLNIKKQFPSISDCLPINSGIHRIYMAVRAMNTLSNNKNIIPIREKVTTGINLPVINHAMSKINGLSEHDQGPLSGKSVLIVENREMIALAQKSLIENMGASATICTRGEDAIKLAKTALYDAFIIEYNFYDCTGIELARSIRETENRNAKIICATSDETAMQDSILLNVVDARLGKNIDPEKLSQLILLPRNPLGMQ